LGGGGRRFVVSRILRLATEGKTVMACERMSQSISFKLLRVGSLVMKSCGGTLVRIQNDLGRAGKWQARRISVNKA
jgi:hypothetical protein